MRDALNIDWDRAFELAADSPQQKYSILLSKLNEARERHIPSRTSDGRKRRPPLPMEVRAAIRKKHRAWQRYMEDRSQQKHCIYTRARNKVTTLTRRAKHNYEEHIASQTKEKPKKFWSYAKSKLKTKEGVVQLCTPGATDENGLQKMTSTDIEKAETLATFFSSVFTIEPPGPVPDTGLSEMSKPFTDPIFTVDDIDKRLNKLKVTKSAGPTRCTRECFES